MLLPDELTPALPIGQCVAVSGTPRSPRGVEGLVRRLPAAGTAVVLLMAWPGTGCSDDGDECDGTIDCDSTVSVRWSPDELAEPDLVRVCLEGVCNEAVPPSTNPATGDLHAPGLDGPLPDGAVTVELQLLDEDGALVETLDTEATVVQFCTCRNISLTVEDGALVQQE